MNISYGPSMMESPLGKKDPVLLFLFFDKKQNTPYICIYIYIHFGQIGYWYTVSLFFYAKIATFLASTFDHLVETIENYVAYYTL